MLQALCGNPKTPLSILLKIPILTNADIGGSSLEIRNNLIFVSKDSFVHPVEMLSTSGHVEQEASSASVSRNSVSKIIDVISPKHGIPEKKFG